MSMNPAFRGHGTFCYMPDEIARYFAHYPNGFRRSSGLMSRIGSMLGIGRAGSASAPETGFVGAFKDMGMSHAWVRLFGLEGVMPEGPTRQLVDKLGAAGIHVAGCYCHGRNPERELATAIEQTQKFGVGAFVADIEPGRLLGGTKSKWGERAFDDFVGGLATHFGTDNLGMSTWPVLKIQNDPEYPSLRLMQIAADHVAMFAPQAYWMSYPTSVHYSATGFRPADYPRGDPAAFVRLVVDSWRAVGFHNPLVITGQAYWGEGAPSQAVMEGKIKTFAAGFIDWPKIAGFNWWHAGGNRFAMSADMIGSIADAKFGAKPYANPMAPVA
jgi:hypothetical protein